MKALFAVLLAALLACASNAAWAAESRGAKAKAGEAKPAQKSRNLFADTRKYLAERSAKTAEVIKGNVERLKKHVAPDPPAADKKKSHDGKSKKRGKDTPSN